MDEDGEKPQWVLVDWAVKVLGSNVGIAQAYSPT
jgi:hypothetical protein